ncbi:MAG: ACP S-malonyltransferase [Promethearchaeota archaeon]
MKKIAFLFPGQGCQYVGMGKSWCKQFSVARDIFKEANSVLRFDIQKLCFDGPFSELTKGKNLQPTILATSIAIYRVFQQEVGIEPEYFVGHSFGELTALTCGQAISFSDALKIARLKGEIVDKSITKPSAMTAVRNVNKKTVEKVCKKISTKRNKVVVAVINSSSQIVISGDRITVKKAEEELVNKVVKLERLRIDTAYHSPLLKEASKKVNKEIIKFKKKTPSIPIISSVTIKQYRSTGEITKNLSLNLIAPVNWVKLIKNLERRGVTNAIEIGPKATLTNLMPEISSKINPFSCGSPKDLNFLLEKFKLDKKNKTDFIIKCLKIAVCTKNYNLDDSEYDREIMRPYVEIKKRLLDLKEKNINPSREDILDSFRIILSILKAKQIGSRELQNRLKEIFLEFPDYYKLSEIKNLLAKHEKQ